MNNVYESNTFHKPGRHQGFTLIEVLVAIVILAIGLLGTASLQLSGLKNINIVGNHSQATTIVNELAERMHINNTRAKDYEIYANTAATEEIADATNICKSSEPTFTHEKDYCAAKNQGLSALRLFVDPETDNLTPMLEVAKCCTCADGCPAGSDPKMYTITVNWAETDYDGLNKLRTYSFNFKP